LQKGVLESRLPPGFFFVAASREISQVLQNIAQCDLSDTVGKGRSADDDYQNVALSMADWSTLDGRAAITVFNDHVAEPDAVVARLRPFALVCVMCERTPMTRAIIERLPNLPLIASATANASIDLAAAAERSVQVVHTGYSSAPTVELTWALILAGARHLVTETTAVRGGKLGASRLRCHANRWAFFAVTQWICFSVTPSYGRDSTPPGRGE
jgi:hypothetical protein